MDPKSKSEVQEVRSSPINSFLWFKLIISIFWKEKEKSMAQVSKGKNAEK